MLSTLWSSNEFITTPFPTNGEPPYFFQEDEPGLSPNLTEEAPPVLSNPGSDNTEPMHLSSNYNANDKEKRKRKCSPSSSDEPSLVDERKQRRMISNRNSARRSRMKKQKNLEDLRNQVNLLEVENRDMMNRLRVMTHHSQILLKQNELIRSESVILQQKLLNLHQALVDRQLDEQLSCMAMQLPSINNYNPHELFSHNNGISSM